MALSKIKKDDTVVVIAGDYKGRTGKVLKVDKKTNRVLVEGINLHKRHIKKTAEGPGKIIERESPIHVSNVALWNASESRQVKVGVLSTENGRVRIDKTTGEKV
jgi:large subunit ribosomal protein L24